MGKDDMAINKDWHLKNKMPAQATVEQRIEWHLEHQRHCSCAPIPQKLLAEMKKRNIQLSDPEVKN